MSLLLSVATGTYSAVGPFNEKVVKGFFLVLSLVFLMLGCRLMINSIQNKYGQEQLMRDIKDINEVTHPFSLVAIKNTFEEFPNQFLLYFDNKWDCWFFPNYDTKEDENDNQDNILNRISNELKVDKSKIDINFRGEETHTKFSPSVGQKKCYYHRLYQVELPLDSSFQIKQFEIDNRVYRWMSPEEMRKNEKIQDKNLDIVEFVTKNIG